MNYSERGSHSVLGRNTNNHPPFFGASYTNVLSQSFNCRFSPVACEDDPPLPLPLYIEHVIRAARLPFEVSVASLIILQRMYMRLMPEIFDHRHNFSPHRLFVCAYVVAGKQYECLRSTDGSSDVSSRSTTSSNTSNDRDSQVAPERSASPLVGDTLRMSDTYWAQITGYRSDELENMQEQLVHTLGRNVAVFQIPGRQVRQYIERLEGCPLMRGLATEQVTLRNLARMTTEEQHAYFASMGTVSTIEPFQGAGQPNRRDICLWWQNRTKSYP